MCRISGCYTPNKQNRYLFIGNALLEQKHGGIDSYGVHTIDNVTFGHNRLAIIDLTDAGSQPKANDRYMLTYNGEWYNYKEVYPLANNDTHALFHSINKNGIEPTLSNINGMFAVAIYDNQEQKIYASVDRFGQKPFYYYNRGNEFYFASNPSVLYDLEPSWEIDRDALQSYWLLGSVMGNNGIFKGIKKLCASELLTYDIKANKIEIKRYYEPKFQDNTNGIEDLVLDAINKVKVSDVPIHIFLSGGIDSSLVASQFTNGQAIHLDSPERQHAQFVADKFNIDLKVCYPETIETEQYLRHYSKFSGEPTMAGLIPYTTAKEVSKHGKVAITANGADELFFGYDRTQDMIGKSQLDHIFRGSLDWFYDRPFSCDFGSKLSVGRMLELNAYIQFDLNKTLDFASMCHGLEVRSPFLDHRLVEMALSINEKQHRRNSNKSILKEMLLKMGFHPSFVNRQKLGFSLHKQPENIDSLIATAWNWVHDNGFLNVKGVSLSGRDKKYIEMSALGFYYWFKVWEHKIK